MYGLPADFDGKFLIGRTVEQICFAEFQVDLFFGESIGITVESSFVLDSKTHNGALVDLSNPIQQSNLMRLLGAVVEVVLTDKEGTLTLRFSNGDTFRCFDPSSMYESYHIRNGDKVIIV